MSCGRGRPSLREYRIKSDFAQEGAIGFGKTVRATREEEISFFIV